MGRRQKIIFYLPVKDSGTIENRTLLIFFLKHRNMNIFHFNDKSYYTQLFTETSTPKFL